MFPNDCLTLRDTSGLHLSLEWLILIGYTLLKGQYFEPSILGTPFPLDEMTVPSLTFTITRQ